ncbi:uncharacterized protein LOC111347427 [Stylophora pistillata]|uniref:uncharacterized protein LOC111347427 n=1 Tax=Stylophora pistillata TaxID=50429 RepID=UPI000C049695|nr:uncharacterized protein LOC111347427 [Stylophora pistillata]
MDKTFAEPVQAEDVTVKNEKITDDTSDKEFVFVLDDTEVYTELCCMMEAREEAREDYEVAKVEEWCTFVNDTKYTVMITDKDGTRPLKPGKSTINLDIPGFELILVLKLPKKDAKIVFPSSGFNNSRQKISQIFANEINQN